MSKRAIFIDAADAETARRYLRRRFETLSWWPTEEPARARAEFEAMQGSPETLALWCRTWLNSGQQRQLEKALREPEGAGTTQGGQNGGGAGG